MCSPCCRTTHSSGDAIHRWRGQWTAARVCRTQWWSHAGAARPSSRRRCGTPSVERRPMQRNRFSAGYSMSHVQRLNKHDVGLYRVAQIKVPPSSKFAISWQQHKILRPILQHLLSTNQWINPQHYAYISIKRNLQYCKGESTIFKFYRLTWIAANCPQFISKDEWPPNSPDLNP